MKNLFTIAILTLMAATSFAKDELFKPRFGGQELKKSGLSYEVVRKPNEFLVYPPKDDSPIPSILTLKFKNKKGFIDKVKLELIPIEPGKNIYSAPVPASIYIAGGLTFDIDFTKKK